MAAFDKYGARDYRYFDDGKFYIRYAMWYFADGNNANFVLFHTEMSMYQYYGFYGYSVEVNMTKTKRGLYLENLYHGIPKGDDYDYVETKAILFMDEEDHVYFCWLEDGAEPINLSNYQLEYARSVLKALDVDSEEFMAHAIP